MHLELPDGSVVEVRPGPYKKGISVIPVVAPEHAAPAGTEAKSTRGRKPRPGTVKLRAKLKRDAKAGRLQDARFYYRWILKEDEGITANVARQVVYRELRAVAEA